MNPKIYITPKNSSIMKKARKKSLFLYVPILGGIINRINKEIAQKGLNYALKNAINQSQSKIQLIGVTEEIITILTKNPAIVISNHLYFPDLIIIGSVFPERKSIFAVANSFFLGLGMNIDRHILPIYMYHYWTKTNNLFIKWLMKTVYFISRQKPHSYNINHVLNRKTIDKATRLISNNALILFFPEDRKHHCWFKGIGHLIKKSNALVNKKTVYIVFVKLEGVSKWDLLRILPIVGKWLPKITVTIIHFSPLSNLKKYKKANTITQLLEKQYNHFFLKTQ